jgi:hypothetical protein
MSKQMTLHECATISGGWLADCLKKNSMHNRAYLNSPGCAFSNWSIWCAINAAYLNERVKNEVAS